MNEKIKIAFFGVGAVGQKICDIAIDKNEKMTNDCWSFNTSEEDIVSQSLIPKPNRFNFGNSDLSGSGKNRLKAFSALNSTLDTITNKFKDIFNNSKPDIVFVAFSTGGGTGSGAGPVIVKILNESFPYIKFVALAFLPSESECALTQENSLKCLSALVKGNFPSIVIDTSRFDDKFRESSVMEQHQKVNDFIVSNIIKFTQYDKISQDNYNIDKTERLDMFSDPGLMLLSSATIKAAPGINPLNAAVMQALNENPVFMDIKSPVKRVAIQFECSPDLLTNANIAQVNSNFKNSLIIHHGYYRPDTATKNEAGDVIQNNKVTIVISGIKFSEKWFQEKEAYLNTVLGPTDPKIDIKIEGKLQNILKADDAAFETKKISNIDKIIAEEEAMF